MPDTATDPAVGEVTLVRRFKAPRELVWKAWTDPAMLAVWWGPRFFTNPEVTLDLRIGGELRIVMRAPDGTDYPMRGVFQAIDPPRLLVFASQAIDADGRVVLDGVTSVSFEEEGGETELTVAAHMTAMIPEAAAYLSGMEAGWTQSLDKLGEQFT